MEEFGYRAREPGDANPLLSDQEKQARLVDLLAARSGIYHNSVKADLEQNRPARPVQPPDTYFYYNNPQFLELTGKIMLTAP